jgi:hypothetical protein
MPEFEKPTFAYPYQVGAQVQALRTYRDTKPGRAIPKKAADRLLLATWNIANLGAQDRRDDDYRLLAEMISWFDLVAVQEVRDDLSGLRGIERRLPGGWRALFTDRAGNQERLAYLYDESRVRLLEKVGEIALPPSEAGRVKLKNSSQRFEGFDRNPFIASFQAGGLRFVLANVHLYFGSASKNKPSGFSINRRALETQAVARWASARRNSPHAYTRDIYALGDFNLPKKALGDPIYDELTGRGLHLPDHTSEIGSNLAGDKHYDQIAFFPGQPAAGPGRLQSSGIFDYDGALFRSLWETRGQKDFFAYLRYYISDHRIFWAELTV